MSDSFILTLDRTPPPLALEVISVSPENVATIRLVSDGEAFEFRLWGPIDTGDPLNGDYSTTESGATWHAFDEEILVKLPVDEFVQLHIQVRDDVWNASDPETLEFGETEVAPPATVSKGAGPVEPAKPKPRPKDRNLSRSTVVGITTSSEVTVEAVFEPAPVTTETMIVSRAIETRSSLLRLSTDRKTSSEIERLASLNPQSLYEVARGPDPADEEAILALLL